MEYKELQETALHNVLGLTDSIINKKYLSFLENSEVYQIRDLKMNELAIELEKHAKIFHLKKFIYDTNENFLHKLITVVNVAYALRGTIITSIQSNGDSIDFYIGIVAKEKKGEQGNKNREALLHAFEGTILGNFAGSDIASCMENQQFAKFTNGIDGKAICSVSVVPSLRNQSEQSILSYVQGIENLVDALRGKKYTVLTIADPVSSSDLVEIRHGYEKVYNYLVPLYKIVETKGTSETINLSQTDTENYVKGLTEGISKTQSKSDSVSYSNGFNLGVSFIVSAGFQHSKNHGTTSGNSLTTSNTRSEQFGTSHGKTVGVGHGTSDSTQISIENRIIKSMLDKIEKNIERVEECEGYGAFQTATYVLADEKEIALNVAGNFISLMKGERSSTQISGINCWEMSEQVSSYRPNKEAVAFSTMMSCLKRLSHPNFKVNEEVQVSTAVMVSGPELTVQLGFPKKSINGLTVLPMHPFGRNVPSDSEKTISLGKLQFMGFEETQEVTLDIDSMAAHTFITGSTGSGKSNAVFHILDELQKNEIRFMVIEPAKGEYKRYFGNRENVHVYGTNEKKTDLLRINPFAFTEEIHVLEHIDRLIEVFNVCWSMYAAMPAVLKEAIEEAYRACGWDLIYSENKYGALFPTFADLQNSLEKVINSSAYDEEVKSNYKGSLLTRVRSLANGISGQIFSSAALSEEQIFEENVIIDLSRVGAMETKSLIMGLLVIKLQEYRMSKECFNSKLHHVTVLEEAHNLLKKTSSEQSMESSNLIGKSVEMLSNAIAEMRSFGEGFIIADQAPGLLDMSVIRNTNTKIILRTPEYTDRLLVGRTAGLNEGQIEELAKLPLGVAAVYQNNWLEAVLCKISKFIGEEQEYVKKKELPKASQYEKRKRLTQILLKKISGNSFDMNLYELNQLICEMDLSSRTKIKVIQAVRKNGKCTVEDISSIMYDMFYTTNIKKEAELTETIEAWKNVIVYGNDGILDELNVDSQNIIVESILCKELELCEKQEEYLDMWKAYVRGEVM